MTGQPWTPEMDAQLRELHGAGFSAREIASRIGGGALNRNAVIGRSYRLGLAGKTQSSITRLARKEARAQDAMPAAAPAGQPCGAVLATASLKGGDCRYPIGDPTEPGFHYCTAPRVGRAYCETHESAAYDRTGTAKSASRAAWLARGRAHKAALLLARRDAA